jgi:hypothetical protein
MSIVKKNVVNNSIFKTMKSMKSYLTFSMFLILMFATLFVSAKPDMLAGKSNTPLGDYQIKPCTPVQIEGQSYKTFELQYEKSHDPILIYIDDQNNCTDYIVRSKYVEVKYVCRKSGFCVDEVFGKHMKYDHVMNNFLMDPDNYKKQMKLSKGAKTEKEALELIATNFPLLLKTTSLL